MKELSIEEKAKAYDIALDKIKRLLGTGSSCSREELEYVFPELKESEDERIIKWIIDDIRYNMNNEQLNNSEYKKKAEKAIAWLEKQGEQKQELLTKEKALKNSPFVEQNPADKVEPKFHEGEWIIGRATENEPRQIAEITEKGYKTTYGGWIGFSFEEDMHLWAIQDAKDGDVLVTCGCILIFEKHLPKDGGVSYCHYDCVSSTPQFDFTKDYNWYFGKEAEVYPATKEQREFLFQKMKEAGYEWNAENKELKKIEQKPAWSEEDETALGDALWCCNQAASIAKDENDMGNVWYAEHWLKSLKERVQPQLKREWSEEDEEMCYKVTAVINRLCAEGKEYVWSVKTLKKLFYWLNSLSPQKKQGWSKEDIEMIDWLIRCCEKEHKELCNDRYGHQEIVSDLKRDCRKKWDWLESLKDRVVNLVKED